MHWNVDLVLLLLPLVLFSFSFLNLALGGTVAAAATTRGEVGTGGLRAPVEDLEPAAMTATTDISLV